MCLYGDDDRVQGEDVEVELMKKKIEQNNSVLDKKEKKYTNRWANEKKKKLNSYVD